MDPHNAKFYQRNVITGAVPSTDNWYSSELISFGLEFSELKSERITPEMLAPVVATSDVGEFLDKWTSRLGEAISEMADPQQKK